MRQDANAQVHFEKRVGVPRGLGDFLDKAAATRAHVPAHSVDSERGHQPRGARAPRVHGGVGGRGEGRGVCAREEGVGRGVRVLQETGAGLGGRACLCKLQARDGRGGIERRCARGEARPGHGRVGREKETVAVGEGRPRDAQGVCRGVRGGVECRKGHVACGGRGGAGVPGGAQHAVRGARHERVEARAAGRDSVDAAVDAVLRARVAAVEERHAQAALVAVEELDAQEPRAHGAVKHEARREAARVARQHRGGVERKHAAVNGGGKVKHARGGVPDADARLRALPRRQGIHGLEQHAADGADGAEVELQPQIAVVADAAPLAVHVCERRVEHTGQRRNLEVRVRVRVVDGDARRQRRDRVQVAGGRPRPRTRARKGRLRRHGAHLDHVNVDVAGVTARGPRGFAQGEFDDDEVSACDVAAHRDAPADKVARRGHVKRARAGLAHGARTHGEVEGVWRRGARAHLEVVRLRARGQEHVHIGERRSVRQREAQVRFERLRIVKARDRVRILCRHAERRCAEAPVGARGRQDFDVACCDALRCRKQEHRVHGRDGIVRGGHGADHGMRHGVRVERDRRKGDAVGADLDRKRFEILAVAARVPARAHGHANERPGRPEVEGQRRRGVRRRVLGAPAPAVLDGPAVVALNHGARVCVGARRERGQRPWLLGSIGGGIGTVHPRLHRRRRARGAARRVNVESIEDVARLGSGVRHGRGDKLLRGGCIRTRGAHRLQGARGVHDVGHRAAGRNVLDDDVRRRCRALERGLGDGCAVKVGVDGHRPRLLHLAALEVDAVGRQPAPALVAGRRNVHGNRHAGKAVRGDVAEVKQRRRRGALHRDARRLGHRVHNLDNVFREGRHDAVRGCREPKRVRGRRGPVHGRGHADAEHREACRLVQEQDRGSVGARALAGRRPLGQRVARHVQHRRRLRRARLQHARRREHDT